VTDATPPTTASDRRPAELPGSRRPTELPGSRRPTELKVERVSRWYGDVIALNDVDLVFGPGVTGLLGPNGAGKSTLIRLLVGQGRSGSGRVLLDGRPVRNDLESLSRIGYVSDGDGLYDELTARRFLLDQARMRGFAGKDRASRVDEILDHVGLTDAADRRAGGFSKGMRQRLKLGQALIHEPDVLVLDEPLTGLDPMMRRDVIAVVREMGDLGLTVVVSSHVLHEIEAMTDQVVLMRHGQVLAEGAVDEIRDHLDDQPRRVALGTPDAANLARSLLTLDDLVMGLQLEPGQLVVHTMHPVRLCAEVQRLAVAGAFVVDRVEPLDADLQSVFSYLVS
jgi:ABC-2 type transport system ATP-binding protein